MAKKNLPACLARATEHGYADMFNPVGTYEVLLKRALDNTRQLAEFFHEHGHYPSQLTTSLGMWLGQTRTAKNTPRAIRRRWYPECEELAIELGCPDMFDHINYEKRGIEKVHQVAEFYKEHNSYPLASTKLGMWLSRMRRQKAANGNQWCSSFGALAIELGCPDMFNHVNDQDSRKQRALDKTRLVAEYKSKNEKYPSVKNGLGLWLSHMREAKLGNKDNRRGNTWYSECEVLAVELGCPDMFEKVGTMDVRERRALDKTREVAEYKRAHGTYPKTNTPLGNWWHNMTTAKSGKRKVNRVWFPSCQDLATELGCPDMFIDNKRERNALAKTLEVIEYHSIHGSYPPANRKGGKLGYWLSGMMQVKERPEVPGTWYPSCEELAVKHDHPLMFVSPGRGKSHA